MRQANIDLQKFLEEQMKKLASLLMIGMFVVPMTIATLTYAQDTKSSDKTAASDSKSKKGAKKSSGKKGAKKGDKKDTKSAS
jgi:hypothetical protein